MPTTSATTGPAKMIASVLRVVGPEGDLEGRQVGELRRRRQQTLGDRVEEDEDADGGVEDGLDQERGGNGRIGGSGSGVDQEDLGGVARVGRDDALIPAPAR